jgi:uncharacterized protein
MIGNLTNEEIEEVLKQNVLGRIGCNDGKRTYVVPVNYVYDGKCIIAHSYEGMKIKMMRKNSDVCFEVDEMKSFTNWKSVIAWGEYQELTDERKRYDAMKLFVDRMLHLKISKSASLPHAVEKAAQPHFPQGNSRSVIYRIVITEKTGRFENE